MLSDKDYKKLLGEFVADDRVERTLREDRQSLQTKIQLEKDKVPERVAQLENQLMELKAKVK